MTHGKITREEVAKDLQTDKFFEPGHIGLKIWQSLFALFCWAVVIFPFLFLLFPIVFPKRAAYLHIFTYKDEWAYFRFLLLFLGSIFLLVSICFILLTLWNNYRFKHFLQKEPQYDVERVEKRIRWFDEAYMERFGPIDFRHNVRYYSVKGHQNLETDFVQKLYANGEQAERARMGNPQPMDNPTRISAAKAVREAEDLNENAMIITPENESEASENKSENPQKEA